MLQYGSKVDYSNVKCVYWGMLLPAAIACRPIHSLQHQHCSGSGGADGGAGTGAHFQLDAAATAAPGDSEQRSIHAPQQPAPQAGHADECAAATTNTCGNGSSTPEILGFQELYCTVAAAAAIAGAPTAAASQAANATAIATASTSATAAALAWRSCSISRQ